MELSFIYMILWHFLNNQFQHRNLSYYKIGTTKCIATKLLHRTYIYFCSNIICFNISIVIPFFRSETHTEYQ